MLIITAWKEKKVVLWTHLTMKWQKDNEKAIALTVAPECSRRCHITLSVLFPRHQAKDLDCQLYTPDVEDFRVWGSVSHLTFCLTLSHGPESKLHLRTHNSSPCIWHQMAQTRTHVVPSGAPMDDRTEGIPAKDGGCHTLSPVDSSSVLLYERQLKSSTFIPRK